MVTTAKQPIDIKVKQINDNKNVKNRQPGKSTKDCQANKVKNRVIPCDIDELVITDTTNKKTVKCTTKFDSTTGTPDEIKHLGVYDILLETLADYDVIDGTPPKKKPKILIKAKNIGNCPTNEHVKYSVGHFETPEKSKMYLPSYISETTINTPPKEFEVVAPPSNLLNSAGWLSPFWDYSTRTRTYAIKVQSCGIRKKGTPNNLLNAAVIVYPNDVYELSLKIPSVMKYSGKKEGSYNIKGDVENSSSSEKKGWRGNSEVTTTKTITNTNTGTNFKTEEYSQTIKNGSDSTTHKITSAEGIKNNEYTIIEKDSITKNSTTNNIISTNKTTGQEQTISESKSEDKLLNKSENVFKPALSFKKNGQELDITKNLNNVLELASKIREAWNEIQNWVPKVGWSATLDIVILEGSIIGKWGNELCTTPASQRLILVKPFYSLTFQCSLIKFDAGISVGIEFIVKMWFTSRPLVELILKIGGSISLDVPIKGTLSSEQDKTPLEFEVTASLKLYGKGRASILGYSASATIELIGCISAKGDVKVSYKQDPVFETNVKMKKTEVNIVLTMSKKKPYKTSVPIFNERDIWKGKFP